MNPKVIIGLSAYNGAKYLKEQLDSLLSQTYKPLEIIVRDDGSTDKSVEILKSYGVQILPLGKNLGPRMSFSALLDAMLQDEQAQYFMFCDQDDIWDKDKVAKSVAKMKTMEQNSKHLPLLVHTDLRVINEAKEILSSSFWSYEHINPDRKKLGNLLMQNTITGCTMLFNRSLAQISLPIPKEAIMHDWWMALVASAFGKIGSIKEPTIFYRQHGGNDTGAKAYSWKKVFKDAGGIVFGRGIYAQHLDINLAQSDAFLARYHRELDANALSTLEAFTTIKSQNYLQKRYSLIRYKLLKYGFMRNLGLFVRI